MNKNEVFNLLTSLFIEVSKYGKGFYDTEFENKLEKLVDLLLDKED